MRTCIPAREKERKKREGEREVGGGGREKWREGERERKIRDICDRKVGRD